MTTPSPAERDVLLTAFSKALFARDVEAIYRAVTPDFVWRLPIGPEAAPGAAKREKGETPQGDAAVLDLSTINFGIDKD